MRDISMERVNETRKNILEIIESATLTHEQKLTCLANQADSLIKIKHCFFQKNPEEC